MVDINGTVGSVQSEAVGDAAADPQESPPARGWGHSIRRGSRRGIRLPRHLPALSHAVGAQRRSRCPGGETRLMISVKNEGLEDVELSRGLPLAKAVDTVAELSGARSGDLFFRCWSKMILEVFDVF